MEELKSEIDDYLGNLEYINQNIQTIPPELLELSG